MRGRGGTKHFMDDLTIRAYDTFDNRFDVQTSNRKFSSMPGLAVSVWDLMTTKVILLSLVPL